MEHILKLIRSNSTIILYILLGYISILLFSAWQEDYPPKIVEKPQQNAPISTTIPENILPIDTGTLPDVPKTQAKIKQNPTNSAIQADSISVHTDVLHLKINLQGGNITAALLEKYPVSINEPETKFQLLGDNNALHFIIQTGIVAKNQATAPSHLSLFTAEKTRYQLNSGEDQLEVNLFWQANGIQVTKRFTFKRGSYAVKVSQIIQNQNEPTWQGWPYQQLERDPPVKSGSMLNGSAYTYTGGAYYKPDTKYQKIKFDEIKNEPIQIETKNGWVSFIQHYFVSAVIPPKEVPVTLFSKALDNNHYVMGVRLPMLEAKKGETIETDSTLYIGPKLQDHLAEIAPGLELTVDYGWLTVISQPLFWLLSKIHSYIGNWGWAIIILTLLLKLAFYKLSETSYKSMANMRKLAPRMQALKERYGEDKQRLNQAMMEMYKTEKINPLGGCLPMLVQIPVFIALYWMLMETVELRQAPFILWIHDLSVKDPYFVLPVLMGASMFFQQKLNPPPPDPMQAKIMSMLPIIFTGLFAFFPAGLVLYWLVNNLASILQQWNITRTIEKAGQKK